MENQLCYHGGMNSPLPITVFVIQFSCTDSSDLGLALGYGDDSDSVLETALSDHANSLGGMTFDRVVDLLDTLAMKFNVGVVRDRPNSVMVDFVNHWSDDHGYGSSIYTRVICTNAEIADLLYETFQESQYDAQADAWDYLDTQQDMYRPDI